MSSTYTTLSASRSTEKAILKVYRIFLITEQNYKLKTRFSHR